MKKSIKNESAYNNLSKSQRFVIFFVRINYRILAQALIFVGLASKLDIYAKAPEPALKIVQ